MTSPKFHKTHKSPPSHSPQRPRWDTGKQPLSEFCLVAPAAMDSETTKENSKKQATAVAVAYKLYSILGTATAGSDVVQSGRPIFDDFFQHLWPYIGNNTANVVFHTHRPMILHSPTENSLAVLNLKILEANSQVQNVKLGSHPTCLSINRLWHELCDMLRRLVGTTAPGHHDCSIQE
ncbi:uncharacterized protein TNCV_1028901 [Trichonephila clavipes]|nr:uncharacterized protein TNCV_1028901 [Trichonephila clavipes]